MVFSRPPRVYCFDRPHPVVARVREHIARPLRPTRLLAPRHPPCDRRCTTTSGLTHNGSGSLVLGICRAVNL